MKNGKVKADKASLGVNKQSFSANSFSELLCDPLVALSLFAVALVALLFTVLDFSRAIS